MFAEPVDLVAKSGLTLLESGVLGAVAVGAVGLAVWAVLRASKTQDQRVQDQVRMSERMEQLMVKMTQTFSDTTNSVNNLAQAWKDAKASLDTVILEAIRRSGSTRNYSPPPTNPIRRSGQ